MIDFIMTCIGLVTGAILTLSVFILAIGAICRLIDTVCDIVLPVKRNE